MDLLPCEASVPRDDDSDLPIALRKGVRRCTNHPIENYVAYEKLLSSYITFASKLDNVQVPNSNQEALRMPTWKQAVEEEIQALEDGLWPDYNDGNYPSCCRSSDFNIEKVSSLMLELQKCWPSLSCGSASLCHSGKGLFWAHEWEKHGTCSYPVIKDEYSYFSMALDLYFKYNMTRILSNEGILASNAKKYSVGDIISAVKKAVGAMPLLECRGGSLEELQLCFDKEFKPRDCHLHSGVGDNDALSSRKSCPIHISLPTYAPSGNSLNGDASSVVSLPIRDESFIPFNVV